jgi:hypothetical protein
MLIEHAVASPPCAAFEMAERLAADGSRPAARIQTGHENSAGSRHK